MKWDKKEKIKNAFDQAFDEAFYACYEGSQDFESAFKNSLESILEKSDLEKYSIEMCDEAFLRYQDFLSKYS